MSIEDFDKLNGHSQLADIMKNTLLVLYHQVKNDQKEKAMHRIIQTMASLDKLIKKEREDAKIRKEVQKRVGDMPSSSKNSI